MNLLKDWVLIPAVYAGDHNQRPSSYIDLLEKSQEAPQVADILHNLNYHDGEMEPWSGYFRRYINSAYYISSQSYPNSNQAFNIDLHWGFPNAPYYDWRITIETLYERTLSLQILGIQVNSLAM